MNPAITIVLPVHNAERTLRSTLMGILELAETAARNLCVAVVDDGSTDGTYEVACELARMYPQVRVFRQAYQCGLGAALDQVRRTLGVGQVIAHSGLAAVDVAELAAVLAAPPGSRSSTPSTAPDPHIGARGSRRFASMAATNARPAAQRSVASFRWLRLDEPPTPRRRSIAAHVMGAGHSALELDTRAADYSGAATATGY